MPLSNTARAAAAVVTRQQRDEKDRRSVQAAKVASGYAAAALEANIAPGQWIECDDPETEQLIRDMWGIVSGPVLCVTTDGVKLFYAQASLERRVRVLRGEPVPETPEPRIVPSLWLRTGSTVAKIDTLEDLGRALQ